ncbi:hypothetical protein B0T19DRAFT_441247 [Cercophora scortea]|uniref:Telomeric single stranded DNA binding POT1/Cdc13 domain-containing protein n=1 Tax=Cercophora scortea TaxID=314031 RepID=A0AAE0IMR2_9PEZI|nr:hypothetical protein B0T19DRAFT_441247 [Cercophora scortea]
MAALLEARAATPIAQLSPDLPDQALRAVRGEVTITWPYNSVTHTLAFLVAEPDVRLRRAKGQVRIELHGPSARAVAECGLGGGDQVLFSLDGAEWATDASPGRIPGARLEWQLRFNEKLDLQVTLSDSRETKFISVDHPHIESPAEPLRERERTPAEPEVNTPEETPVVRRITDLAMNEYPSPAFIKRARMSYGSLFEDGLDIFEEDGGARGKGRKRTRFGRDSSAWRYTSQSPSPEPETPARDDMEEDPIQETPSQPSPNVQMLDEGCQTVELDIPAGATLSPPPLPVEVEATTSAAPSEAPREALQEPPPESTQETTKVPSAPASPKGDLEAAPEPYPRSIPETPREQRSPSPHAQPTEQPALRNDAVVSQELSQTGGEQAAYVHDNANTLFGTSKPINHGLSMFGTSPAVPLDRSFNLADQVRFGFSHTPQTTQPLAGRDGLPTTQNDDGKADAYPVSYLDEPAPNKYADMQSYVDIAEDEMELVQGHDIGTQPPIAESFDRVRWEMQTQSPHYNQIEGGHFGMDALIEGTRIAAEEPLLHSDAIPPQSIPAGFSSYGPIQTVDGGTVNAEDSARNAGYRETEELAENAETRRDSDEDVGIEDTQDAEHDDYDEQLEEGDYDQRNYNVPDDDDEGLSVEDDEIEQEAEDRYGDGETFSEDDYGEDWEGEDGEDYDSEDSYLSDDAPPNLSQRPVSTAAPSAPVVISLLSDSEDDDDGPPPRKPLNDVVPQRSTPEKPPADTPQPTTGENPNGVSRHQQNPISTEQRANVDHTFGSYLQENPELSAMDVISGAGVSASNHLSSALGTDELESEDEEHVTGDEYESELDEGHDQPSSPAISADNDRLVAQQNPEAPSEDSGSEEDRSVVADDGTTEDKGVPGRSSNPFPNADDGHLDVDVEKDTDDKKVFVRNPNPAPGQDKDEVGGENEDADADAEDGDGDGDFEVDEDADAAEAEIENEDDQASIVPDEYEDEVDVNAENRDDQVSLLSDASADEVLDQDSAFVDHQEPDHPDSGDDHSMDKEELAAEVAKLQYPDTSKQDAADDAMAVEDDLLAHQLDEEMEQASVQHDKHNAMDEDQASANLNEATEVDQPMSDVSMQEAVDEDIEMTDAPLPSPEESFQERPLLEEHGREETAEIAHSASDVPGTEETMIRSEIFESTVVEIQPRPDLEPVVQHMEQTQILVVESNRTTTMEPSQPISRLISEDQIDNINPPSPPFTQPLGISAQDNELTMVPSPAASRPASKNENRGHQLLTPMQSQVVGLMASQPSVVDDHILIEDPAPVDDYVVIDASSQVLPTDTGSSSPLRSEAQAGFSPSPALKGSDQTEERLIEDLAENKDTETMSAEPRHEKSQDVQSEVGNAILDAPSPRKMDIVVEIQGPKEDAERYASVPAEPQPSPDGDGDGSPLDDRLIVPTTPEPLEHKAHHDLENEEVTPRRRSASARTSPRVLRARTPAGTGKEAVQEEITVRPLSDQEQDQHEDHERNADSQTVQAEAHSQTEATPSSPDLSIHLARQSVAAKTRKKPPMPLRTSPRITRARSNSIQMSASPEGDDSSANLARASLASPSKLSITSEVEDSSVSLAKASLASPSRLSADIDGGSLKSELRKRLRDLPDCVSLKSLRPHVEKYINVVGVVASEPSQPARAKGGPREYMMSFNVTDPTASSPNLVVEVQLYRPHKESLPVVKPGDAILLQKFQAKSVSKKGFGLRTGNDSAWAVWDGDADDAPQIKGPPVEDYADYSEYMLALKAWYKALDNSARGKLDKANKKFEELNSSAK